MQQHSYVIQSDLVDCPNLSICFCNMVKSVEMVRLAWLHTIIQLLQSAFINFCTNLQILYLDNHITAYGLHSAKRIPCIVTFSCQKSTNAKHLQLST
jgi:hypothetical protein